MLGEIKKIDNNDTLYQEMIREKIVLDDTRYAKELQKYNGQSLKHASSQYYRTSRPKSAIVPEQKIYKQTRPVSASTCYESKMAERNNHRNYKSKTIINSNNRTFRDGYKVKKEKIMYKLIALRF